MRKTLILGLLLCKVHAGGSREELPDPNVTLEVQVQPGNFPFPMTLPLSDVSQIHGLGERTQKIRKEQKEQKKVIEHMRKEAARRDTEVKEMREYLEIMSKQMREMYMRILSLESLFHAVPSVGVVAAQTPTSEYSKIMEGGRLGKTTTPPHASHTEPDSPAAASVHESEASSEWLVPDIPDNNSQA